MTRPVENKWWIVAEDQPGPPSVQGPYSSLRQAALHASYVNPQRNPWFVRAKDKAEAVVKWRER